MTPWSCGVCGWEGFSPAYSDASDLRPDVHGNLVMDRTHVPICPRCFAEVQTLRARQARELRAVILDLAGGRAQ